MKAILLYASLLAGLSNCLAPQQPLPGIWLEAQYETGVIVAHHPSPSLWQLIVGPVYTASPSIVVLPCGELVLSYNIFGRGSGADESGTTYVYHSEDGGLSWVRQTILMDMKRGSMFVHNGDLYIWGYRNNSGDIVISRSLDKGQTWTSPNDAETGLLREGTYGGTPNNPVVFDGRIWVAQGGKRVMSAPAQADLLRADSWTLSNRANTENGPFGPGLVITEAQIVASPETGVVLLPKVGGLPYTVLLHVESPERVRNPRDEDWVYLPGGEKKFGATYDPVSQEFFVLSNPVLPEYEATAAPELVRNVAAIFRSPSLTDWNVGTIFLHSPNAAYEAFQYLNFTIDADDLLIASRTALYLEGDTNQPPRGHDSNRITFHRIENFRQVLPNYDFEHFIELQP